MKDLDGWERIRLQLARSGKEQSYAKQSRDYRNPANTIKFAREKTMQRDYDEVQGLLDLWADDYRKPSQEVQGYPSEASGGFIASWRKDDEEVDEANERVRISIIDAAFNDLKPRYQNAIKLHYGIMRRTPDVWRHYVPATFDEAKIVIRVKFVQRGLL